MEWRYQAKGNTNLSIASVIKQPVATVFRRAYIKRRSTSTGLFESDWVEITSDVKSWGKVSSQIDSVRLYTFTFGNMKMVMHNDDGRYNPEDEESSLWYGYLNQQRTLVKIEAGFVNRTKIDGVWYEGEYPSQVYWDKALWDFETSLWDQDITPIVFTGVVSGDISLMDTNEVSLNIKPLTSIFQDYPARNLTGWTSTGFTASNFINLLRDQTDGSSGFVFRNFFNNTTTYWDISATSVVYSNLNTSTAKDVIDSTVWDIIEKLSEAENYVPYVTRDGIFKFVSREANTVGVSYEFHGAGSPDSYYGSTVTKLNSAGRKISKYYSRVQVKWKEEDTSTSYEVVESQFLVSGNSNPWVLGTRTLEITNLFIPTAAVANSLATAIFNDYSALKKEIDFSTTFVPHLDLLDRFAFYYDPTVYTANSLWDEYNWAFDSTDTTSDLIFDYSKGDAINFSGQEFKFLSFEIDLDNLSNRFIAREV
jgi:hypothetical protein